MASERNRPKANLLDTEKEKHVAEMLDQLEDERRLSTWEMNFVTETSDWFKNKPAMHSLSPAQYLKLEEIYNKYNN